ncbi:MAG TPA: hypothetical protein VFP36_00590 [Usitatibacter sp.]|nr:hypothetical protein [Usitatibacter sp.]
MKTTDAHATVVTDRQLMLFNGFMAAAMAVLAMQTMPKGTVEVPMPKPAAASPAMASDTAERSAEDISAAFQAIL